MDQNNDQDERRVCLDRAMRDWGETVYRLAYSRMGCRADAEDVTQTVFLRLVSADRAFEDEEHLKAWLLRVTINCCNDMYASAWTKHRASLEDAELCEADAFDVEGCSAGSDIEAVRCAIGNLSDGQRTAIHLFYGEGYKTEEIARLTGEKPGTVRIHLHRARATLRKALGGIDGWQ